jgi:hypothetical protein
MIRKREKTGIVLPCLMLLLFAAACVWGSVPIISKMTVAGGARGIAISISSDAPIKANVSRNGSTAVNITFSDCIYGLKAYSYDSFPPGVPLKRITVKEKDGSQVVMTLNMSQPLSGKIKIQQKDNRFLALLSSEPVEEFRWTASVQDGDTEHGIMKASADPSGIASLKEIRFLRREYVGELSFLFDNQVTGKIRKSGDSLVVLFSTAVNGLGKQSFVLPDGSLYKRIDLREKKIGENTFLGAVIRLDKKAASGTPGIASSQENAFSLFTFLPEVRKASLWSSQRGVEWDYEFYTLPSYPMDLKSMGERAVKDVESRQAIGSTFNVNERAESSMPEKKQPPVVSGSVSPAPEEKKLPVNTRKTLVVVADRVNYRNAPSMSGAVSGRLEIGEFLNFEKQENGWVCFSSDKGKGWVLGRFVVDSSKVSQGQWERIKASRVQPVQESRPEEPQVAESQSPKKIESIADSVLAAHTPGTRVIKYSAFGRDPFVALKKDSVSHGGKPFVENLKLVGILFDNTDRLALLEDRVNNRRPFALREEDQIDHGKVLKIYKDKVVFLLTEYGISRSYTMRLNSNSRQEAGN